MANPVIAPNLQSQTFPGVCGATTLVGKEGYAVKQHTDGTWIVCASQGERGFILVTGGAVGEAVTIACSGVPVVVVTDGTSITYGTMLTPEAGGKLELAATGDFVCAIALEAATVDGQVIRAMSHFSSAAAA